MMRITLGNECQSCFNQWSIQCIKLDEDCNECSNQVDGRCNCLQDATKTEEQTCHCSYYKPIPKPTKQMIRYWQLYNNTPSRSLYDAYVKASDTKARIYELWQKRYPEIRVLTYNSQHFVLATTYQNLFIVITKTKFLVAMAKDLKNVTLQ